LALSRLITDGAEGVSPQVGISGREVRLLEGEVFDDDGRMESPTGAQHRLDMATAQNDGSHHGMVRQIMKSRLARDVRVLDRLTSHPEGQGFFGADTVSVPSVLKFGRAPS
jgi:hypothetical protein